ncbi:trichohyalin-like [Penaeus vannamei]|uniref:trichohyalin-like n=1 Tax=Penaeus vannamei TaxID=6689 RepID=UPI00387F6EBA
MESFLKEMERVRTLTEAEFQRRTSGWRSTALGSGHFGSATLFSNGRLDLVAKRMSRSEDWAFKREVRALSAAMGVEGVQQLKAVVVEADYSVTVSRFAGVTLGRCVEERISCRPNSWSRCASPSNACTRPAWPTRTSMGTTSQGTQLRRATDRRALESRIESQTLSRITRPSRTSGDTAMMSLDGLTRKMAAMAVGPRHDQEHSAKRKATWADERQQQQAAKKRREQEQAPIALPGVDCFEAQAETTPASTTPSLDALMLELDMLALERCELEAVEPPAGAFTYSDLKQRRAERKALGTRGEPRALDLPSEVTKKRKRSQRQRRALRRQTESRCLDQLARQLEALDLERDAEEARLARRKRKNWRRRQALRRQAEPQALDTLTWQLEALGLEQTKGGSVPLKQRRAELKEPRDPTPSRDRQTRPREPHREPNQTAMMSLDGLTRKMAAMAVGPRHDQEHSAKRKATWADERQQQQATKKRREQEQAPIALPGVDCFEAQAETTPASTTPSLDALMLELDMLALERCELEAVEPPAGAFTYSDLKQRRAERKALGTRGEPRALDLPSEVTKKRKRSQRQRRALRRQTESRCLDQLARQLEALDLERDAEEARLARRKRKNWRRRQALRRQAEPQALDTLTWQLEALGLEQTKGGSVPLKQRRAELKALRAAERQSQGTQLRRATDRRALESRIESQTLSRITRPSRTSGDTAMMSLDGLTRKMAAMAVGPRHDQEHSAKRKATWADERQQQQATKKRREQEQAPIALPRRGLLRGPGGDDARLDHALPRRADARAGHARPRAVRAGGRGAARGGLHLLRPEAAQGRAQGAAGSRAPAALGTRGEPRALDLPSEVTKKRKRSQRQRRALRRQTESRCLDQLARQLEALDLERDAEEARLARRKRKNWRRRQALRRQAEPQALDTLTWQLEALGLEQTKGGSVPLKQRRAELKALRAAERQSQGTQLRRATDRRALESRIESQTLSRITRPSRTSGDTAMMSLDGLTRKMAAMAVGPRHDQEHSAKRKATWADERQQQQATKKRREQEQAPIALPGVDCFEAQAETTPASTTPSLDALMLELDMLALERCELEAVEPPAGAFTYSDLKQRRAERKALGTRGEPRALDLPSEVTKKRKRSQRQRRALRRQTESRCLDQLARQLEALDLERDAEEARLARRKRKNWRRRQALRRQAEPQALDTLTWQLEALGLEQTKGGSVPLKQRRAELKALRAAERQSQGTQLRRATDRRALESRIESQTLSRITRPSRTSGDTAMMSLDGLTRKMAAMAVGPRHDQEHSAKRKATWADERQQQQATKKRREQEQAPIALPGVDCFEAQAETTPASTTPSLDALMLELDMLALERCELEAVEPPAGAFTYSDLKQRRAERKEEQEEEPVSPADVARALGTRGEPRALDLPWEGTKKRKRSQRQRRALRRQTESRCLDQLARQLEALDLERDAEEARLARRKRKNWRRRQALRRQAEPQALDTLTWQLEALGLEQTKGGSVPLKQRRAELKALRAAERQQEKGRRRQRRQRAARRN